MGPLTLLSHSYLRVLERTLLFAFDITAFILAFNVAHAIRLKNLSWQISFAPQLLLPLTITLATNLICNLYEPSDSHLAGSKIPGRTIFASGASLMLIGLATYMMGVQRFSGNYFGRGVVLGTMACFSCLALMHRTLLSNIFRKVRHQRRYLVLATKKEFNSILKENKTFSNPEGFDFLDSINDCLLMLKIAQKSYTGLIVGNQALQNTTLVKNLMELRFKKTPIFTVSEFFEAVWLKVPVLSLEDQWFVTGSGFSLFHNSVRPRIKRLSDIIFSLSLMVMTSPLMALAALLIKLSDFGPVIYSQIRTGEHGKNFTIYKFRSMKVCAEDSKAQWAQKNDSRVTKIGKILRLTRIDELPQTWNVLKGDMSLIGPRPERPEFNIKLEHEIPYYSIRHWIKPGITGWAQILYPYGASSEDALEKLQYDFYYIKHYSFLLDFNILIKTIAVMLTGSGR